MVSGQRMRVVDIDSVARVAHGIVGRYELVMGDDSAVGWLDLSREVRIITIRCAEAILGSPLMSLDRQHAMWCRGKLENWWLYGEVKDVVMKRHPSLVEFEQLSLYAQWKCALFGGVVRGMGLHLGMIELEDFNKWFRTANIGISRATQKGSRMSENVSSIEKVAETVYEINRLYCLALGDDSQVPWGGAPLELRDSVIAGIEAIIEHPELTPEDQHNCWLDYKRASGWVYGDEKDLERKTHPCMVEYYELPVQQRAKDHIFGAVVRGLLGLTQ